MNSNFHFSKPEPSFTKKISKNSKKFPIQFSSVNALLKFAFSKTLEKPGARLVKFFKKISFKYIFFLVRTILQYNLLQNDVGPQLLPHARQDKKQKQLALFVLNPEWAHIPP